MVFLAKINPKLVVLGCQFRDGIFETNNPRIIDALKKSPFYGKHFIALADSDVASINKAVAQAAEQEREKQEAKEEVKQEVSVDDVVEKAKEKAEKAQKQHKAKRGKTKRGK